MNSWLLIAIVLAAAGASLAVLLVRSVRESAKRLKDSAEANASLSAARDIFRQQLRVLSESSGSGVIVLDSQGRILHANATADAILDRKHNSMVGHSLIQATLSSELQEFAIDAARSMSPQARDFRLPGPQARILKVSLFPFKEGLSGGAETMLVLSDVTNLRRLETMRRDFVANVSHELRTPLASIRAMAETLQDGALNDPEVSDRFLSTIIRESDRLARISEDLLVLSNAESKEPDKEDFDLAQLVKEVVERSQPQAIELGIDLSAQADSPLIIRASRDHMEQVLVNLVDNALKFTGTEGKVSVAARVEDEWVHLEVCDTGIGIMHEHHDRIFERFYRVDKARSRESGGTGLGLSIVKNIVEAHGGTVMLESQLNHGSIFTIKLPNQ